MSTHVGSFLTAENDEYLHNTIHAITSEKVKFYSAIYVTVLFLEKFVFYLYVL